MGSYFANSPDSRGSYHCIITLAYMEKAMTPTEKNDLNRRFAKLCGIESEDIVISDDLYQEIYPDFVSDPRLVLEVMMKREDAEQWAGEISQVLKVSPQCHEYTVPASLILDTTGLLTLKGIEWMEKQAEPGGGE